MPPAIKGSPDFQVQGDGGIQPDEKNSWLGAQISLADAEALAKRCGFRLVRSAGFGTQYAWLWFEKPGKLRFPRGRFWPVTLLKRKRMNMTFSREIVQPGESYAVRVVGLASCRIDVAYEFFGESGGVPVTGVVSRWCELDANGEAVIPVPPGHPGGRVRVTKVRPNTRDGRWRETNAEIRVSGPVGISA